MIEDLIGIFCFSFDGWVFYCWKIVVNLFLLKFLNCFVFNNKWVVIDLELKNVVNDFELL